MLGLRRSVQRYDRTTREVLNGCVAAVEAFRADGSSTTLKEIQDGLRGLIWDCEARIRRHSDRRGIRAKRVRDLVGASVGPLMSEHHDWLRRRDAVLARRRSALRQIGDALAWLLLRGDMGAISAVYDDSRTHQLPPLEALTGQATLIEQITDLTNLLVIDNDLTRILGVGDLTIATPRSQPLRPFFLEVRTHGNIVTDPSTTLTINGVFPDSDLDEGIRSQLRAALHFEEGPGPPPGSRKHRQLEEITKTTERLYRVLSRDRARLAAPAPVHVKTIEQVLRHADVMGYAFDLPRNGVAYLAVSQSDGAEVDPNPALEKLARAGVAVDDPAWGSVSSISIEPLPDFGLIIPPVALWPFPPDLRARILNQDLVLLGYIRRDVWKQSFAKLGWELEVTEERGWRIRNNGHERELVWSAAVHAQLGTAFLGFDPDNVAQTVVE